MIASRRTALKGVLLASGAAASPGAAWMQRRSSIPAAPLGWVEGEAPALQLGQTVGVAWPRGAVRRGTAFAVRDGEGRPVPSQTWATATWPDGSLKWSAHALPAGAGWRGLTVTPGVAAKATAPVRVEERGDAIVIRIGMLAWEIARRGDVLIRAARDGDRPLIGPVTLVGGTGVRGGGKAEALTGVVERVTVESSGPIRAVVRIEGHHRAGERQLLPFDLRLYAYAGARHLRVIHTVVFDVDPARDLITSLGLRAAVPMRGPAHDRHFRVATDGAPFAEAVRPLTGLRRDPGEAFRAAQIAGRATPPLAQMAAVVRSTIERIPVWNDVSLSQPTANGFAIAKRTAAPHGWVPVTQGRRAPGLAFVGGPDGGAAIGQRWFWERHPSALHIRDAASDQAALTAWLWSPDAPLMDLASYRGTMGMEAYPAQNEGLAVTYEDYEPGWDDARGVARTSELTLWALPATPSQAEFAAMASAIATPPQLMAAPAHLHAAQVFGDWSLPDRSSPNRAAIEDQLVNLVDFYAGEVDRRSWYGFWDHGDVMHSYDADRHQWRYDVGGFAWANSELSPDLWLWYQALRTGAAQPWRLAEAMTRHTAEVDSYHLGRFAGLGTRHGVQHWSDSSKQPRVANAIYRRIFYYLTADERTGDILREYLRSEQSLTGVDIGRKVPNRRRAPVPAGTVEMAFGPTWTALAGAWLAEWERTGDPRWRDRITAGMDSIGRMERGWLTGSAAFDLKSGRFLDPGAKVSLSHLSAVFGAVEINSELLSLLDVPRYRAAWLEYCRWYNAPRRAFEERFGTGGGGRNLREGHARLTAYAARASGDPALAARAAAEFLSGDQGLGTWTGDPRRTVAGVVEWPNVSTNAASQWGLSAIQILALTPEAIDGAVIPAYRSDNKAQEVSHARTADPTGGMT